MKLSDFKGEEAIEVLADIIAPASEIVSDGEFQRMCSTSGVPYMKIVSYVLKEHKKSILDMYEPLMQESREKATPTKLVRLVLDIAQDPEITSLFFSQGQQEALTSSGSVTENTGDGLK